MTSITRDMLYRMKDDIFAADYSKAAALLDVSPQEISDCWIKHVGGKTLLGIEVYEATYLGIELLEEVLEDFFNPANPNLSWILYRNSVYTVCCIIIVE